MPALFDRKSGNCLILAMLMAFGLGTSCSDENLVNDMQGKEQLSFGVSISDKWNTGGTRSANDEETVSSTKIENSDLWLITTVEDNPDTTLFMQPEEETRGTTITKTNFYNSFGVYAYTYTGTWATANDKKLYIDGDQAEQENGIWITKPSRFWPGDAYTMKFFAFAPYDIKDKFSVNGATPTISYTVVADAKKHKDILFASTIVDENDKEKDIEEVPGNYHNTLNLRFRHLLTAINVEVSDPLNRKIKSVKFTGVHASGNYTYGGTDWDTTDGTDKEISCDVDVDLSGSTPDNPTEVIKDDNGTTFMMIPQTLGSETKIGVTLTDQDGKNEKTLWANLTGEWQMGKKVTYIISAVNAILEVELAGNFEDYEYYGGSKFFTVKSYMTTGTDVEPAAWIAEFSADGGTTYSTTPPSCLVDFKTSGDGSKKVNETIEHEVCTAKVAAQIGNVSNTHNLALRGTDPVGSDSQPYELSTKGGTESMNTANCYIVKAPGTYSFPLVYGNAVQDGVPKSDAYTSTVGLKNFLNHKNLAITASYIGEDKNANEIDHADLVWQDVLNLVTNIRLVPGTSAREARIVFDVTQERIQQGNAIIAVRDANNTILWSWHIWVTDFVPLSGLQSKAELNAEGEAATTKKTYDIDEMKYDKVVYSNNNGDSYTFMGQPIGFCHGETTVYNDREVKVRVTQTSTNEFKIITIRQKEKTITTGMNAPYYQWGRKDPMLPSNGTPVNKIHYNKDGVEASVWGVGTGWTMDKTTIGKGITNPHLFCPNKEMDNQAYYNLWDRKNEIVGHDIDIFDIPTKTIYDPSPVGYVIPHDGAYSGVTYNGLLCDGGKTQPWASSWPTETYPTFYQSGYNSPYTKDADFEKNNGCIIYCSGMNKSRLNYNIQNGIVFYPFLGKRNSNFSGELSTGSLELGGALFTSGTPYSEVHMHRLFIIKNCLWPRLANPRGEGLSARPIREQQSKRNKL